LEQKHEC